MWRVILISVIVLALGVLGLCINIIFTNDGKFPDGEVGHNKQLRKQGIVCAREEDEKIWGRSSHIQITKKKRIKNIPGPECGTCTEDCQLRRLAE